MDVEVIRAAVSLLVVAGLCACGEPASVQVGSGSIGSDVWSSSVYDSGGEGVCLQISQPLGDPDRLCGLSADESGTWQIDAPAGHGSFVAGYVANAAAQRARVTLADGTQLIGDLAAAADVTTLRFYVLPVSAGSSAPKQLELLDADGAVLQSTDLGP